MADPSTHLGGPHGAFPQTHWSVVRDALNVESPTRKKSLDELARTYWRPVYAYFRRKWGKANDEAKDLTQSFFLAVSEDKFTVPDRSRFRTYVRAALDNAALMQHRFDSRLKRGGGVDHFSLDIGEGFEPMADESADDAFSREWAQTMLDNAMRTMEQEYRASGQGNAYALFRLHDIESPEGEDLSYKAMAKRFGIKETDVTNFLYRARRRLRELLLEMARETVEPGVDPELEIRELFGEG